MLRYLYLDLTLGLIAVLVLVWITRRDLRSVILTVGPVGSLIEMVTDQLWYKHDYWHPPVLLPAHIALIEDALYGFAVQRQFVVRVVDGRGVGSGRRVPGVDGGVASSTSFSTDSMQGVGLRTRVASRRRISLLPTAGSGRARRVELPLLTRCGGVGLGSGGGQVSGEQVQRDVGVPGAVVADLLVVEPGFILGALEALLDRPDRAPEPTRKSTPATGWSSVRRSGRTPDSRCCLRGRVGSAGAPAARAPTPLVVRCRVELATIAYSRKLARRTRQVRSPVVPILLRPGRSRRARPGSWLGGGALLGWTACRRCGWLARRAPRGWPARSGRSGSARTPRPR